MALLLKSHLLSAIIFLPIVGVAIVAILPKQFKSAAKYISLFIAILTLVLALFGFRKITGTGDFEIIEQVPWIDALSISYHVGVDGVSVLLVILAAILTPLSILVSWNEITKNIKSFYAAVLFLEFGLLGVFTAIDMFLFYTCWEIVLISIFFLVGIWGSGDRIAAATKFIVFMALVSLIMLGAIIYSANAVRSFDIIALYAHSFTLREQFWLFGAFAISFAAILPIMGLNTWFWSALKSAPTVVVVLLAGVVIKMGAYGFLRIAMPAFPLAVAAFVPAMLVIAVIGIIVGALLTMVQKDLKGVIAYASISQMGFILLGLAALDPQSVSGAIFQMMAHGFAIGALALVTGMLCSRTNTLSVGELKGTAKELPALSVFFIFISLALIGIPGLGNFAGNFLILLGSFQTRTIFAAISITGLVLIAAAFLGIIGRVFFGTPKSEDGRHLKDLNVREYAILLPIVIIIFMLGMWPGWVLSKVWRSSDVFIKLSKQVEMYVPAGDGAK